MPTPLRGATKPSPAGVVGQILGILFGLMSAGQDLFLEFRLGASLRATLCCYGHRPALMQHQSVNQNIWNNRSWNRCRSLPGGSASVARISGIGGAVCGP